MGVFYDDNIVISGKNAVKIVQGLTNTTTECARARDIYMGHIEDAVTLQEKTNGYIVDITDMCFDFWKI